MISKKNIPNLIIPGAQKSGTTTLFSILNQHNNVFFPENKEPHFFSKFSNLDNFENYLKLFSDVTKQHSCIGDASTSYLFEPEAPRRLKKHLGNDLKLIFILRNPAERAISAYWHLYKRKIHGSLNWYENRNILDAFDTSIENLSDYIENEKLTVKKALEKNKIFTHEFDHQYDSPSWPFHYVENSRYAPFIENYLEYFDKSQMLFLTTEELKKDPRETFNTIASFLNIDKVGLPDPTERFNLSVIPKKGFFNEIIHYIHPYLNKVFGFRFPGFAKRYRKKYYLEPKNPLELVSFIDNLFKEDTKRLSSLINKDLDLIWKK